MKKLLLILSAIFLAGCSGESTSTNEGPVGLKGKFVNDTSIKVLHRKDIVTDGQYVYTSSYPLNQLTGYGCYETYEEGQDFVYNFNQSLILYKDFTYQYSYSISFGNAWSNPDLLGIDVDISGTYKMNKKSDTEYIISISSPLAGTESYYGCNFSVNELWWFGGGIAHKHSSPDKEIDFELLKSLGKEEIDWYVRPREVRIEFSTEKNEPNVVHDYLFNAYILDDVGQFCTY